MSIKLLTVVLSMNMREDTSEVRKTFPCLVEFYQNFLTKYQIWNLTVRRSSSFTVSSPQKERPKRMSSFLYLSLIVYPFLPLLKILDVDVEVRLRALRRIDRTRNGANWPDLYYPELYLLEGGYSAFYSLFPEYCDPQGYVKMKEDHQSNKDGHLARRNSVQDLSADFGELRTRRRSPRNLRGSSSGSPMRSRAASPRFLDRLMEEEEADRNTTNNNNNQITVEEKREGVVPFTLKIPIMRTKQ